MGKRGTSLTADQVNLIITLCKAGAKNREISQKLGVSEGTVSRRIGEMLGNRQKQVSTCPCSKSIDDCLNCKKPFCDFNGPVQPHEKNVQPVNSWTIDMYIEILKKA